MVGANMFTCLIVAFSALHSASAQVAGDEYDDEVTTIKDLHLHATLGEGLPEIPPRQNFELIDEYVSEVAETFVKAHIPQDPLQWFTLKYGPIEDVVIPGVKLTRPINLKHVRITGLNLDGLSWRMESNRLWFNASVPTFQVQVTFDNVQIDKYFVEDGGEFVTSIRLMAQVTDLDIVGSVRYNVKAMPTPDKPNLFIDKAEVDIYAKDVLYEMKVQQGLEEVRYVLAEMMNSLDDVMNAVLKVVVKKINKELLGKVYPQDVTSYLIANKPRYFKVPIELIVINPI